MPLNLNKMKPKLNEFEKHFIKNAVDLYMEQINKELDEMKNDLNRPKKSRRKPKSERNTVSLNFN